MMSLFQAIENNSKELHAGEIVVPLSQALIVKACSIIEKNAVPVAETNSPLTTKVITYIDAHYKEDIRLKDIAAATKISIYYLSHAFKADVGFSPMQYVILRRIGEAQSLLINTDLNITHVAAIVGYNNSNYFQNVFRKLFGITPGEYRRKWKI
jgi:YesN/AraC family two-component response regulator